MLNYSVCLSSSSVTMFILQASRKNVARDLWEYHQQQQGQLNKLSHMRFTNFT